MVVVAWKYSSRLTQGQASGDLCLRIVGTSHRGEVARLAAPKCTIGSAEGCSLRLRAAGVRPLHCVILRGLHGTVVRSWAPDTRLNGQPFNDAILMTGDRLGIGPIELEVVDGQAARMPSEQSDTGEHEREHFEQENARMRREMEEQIHAAEQAREEFRLARDAFERQRESLDVEQREFDRRREWESDRAKACDQTK